MYVLFRHYRCLKLHSNILIYFHLFGLTGAMRYHYHKPMRPTCSPIYALLFLCKKSCAFITEIISLHPDNTLHAVEQTYAGNNAFI